MKITIRLIIYLYILSLAALVNMQPLFAQVQTGKSYINVSKNINGGTFEPGDTLEIRATIAVGNFSSYSITKVRYNDTINSNFTYLPGTLKILTNEGLVFRAYTDAANDDPAMFNNINKTLRINMGSTAGNATNTGNATTGGGTIANNNKPSFFGGVCIMVASYRVKINSSLTYNTLLTIPGGAIRYTSSGSDIIGAFTPSNLMLFQNIGVCPNYIGGNAVIENGGTFGSGTAQNRSASAIVPGYTFINFSANQPNDGYYGIANNSSATGATNNGVAVPHSSRVFQLWDIIGDHTGAANPSLGNPATAVGSPGGYMAVINASYAISPAIQQTVSNLCPSTYYDFSAWFRNICSKCASDSNGNGALDAKFNGPYPPGVKPNLTFQLNGIDYYTTGDIPYTGLWTKKGFTYLTGAVQTSFTLSIRNNSPGGGGNDWAVDDVNLSTCVPDIELNYSPEFKGCYGSLVELSSKIKCWFPNYTFYKWQLSINGGVSWLDTGVSGNGSPTYVSGQWEYTAAYPPFIANQPDSGHRYRVVVATTAANLSNTNCSYSNNSNIFLNIINCGVILNATVSNFSGTLVQSYANLSWQISTGNNISHFQLEKSSNGTDFKPIANLPYQNISSYSFTDPQQIADISFYRLKIFDINGYFVYSKIIVVSNSKINFEIKPFTNPVTDKMQVDYMIPETGTVTLKLYNAFGAPLLTQQLLAKKGWNKSSFDFVKNLPAGMYIFSFVYKNSMINKKVIKM